MTVFESQISRRAGARARSLGSKKATNFDSGRSAGRTAPGQTDGTEREGDREGAVMAAAAAVWLWLPLHDHARTHADDVMMASLGAGSLARQRGGAWLDGPRPALSLSLVVLRDAAYCLHIGRQAGG